MCLAYNSLFQPVGVFNYFYITNIGLCIYSETKTHTYSIDFTWHTPMRSHHTRVIGRILKRTLILPWLLSVIKLLHLHNYNTSVVPITYSKTIKIVWLSENMLYFLSTITPLIDDLFIRSVFGFGFFLLWLGKLNTPPPTIKSPPFIKPPPSNKPPVWRPEINKPPEGLNKGNTVSIA